MDKLKAMHIADFAWGHLGIFMELDTESRYFTDDRGVAMYPFDTVIEDLDFIVVSIDEEREVRLLSREERAILANGDMGAYI